MFTPAIRAKVVSPDGLALRRWGYKKQVAAQPIRSAAEMGVIAAPGRESMKLDQIFVIKKFNVF
jgi:hypothetical protein